MRESTAAVIGFLAAPIIPGLALGLGTPLGPPDLSTVLATMLGLLPVGYFFSLVAILVFGVPAFLLGRRLNLIRWWSAVISGFFIGVLVAVVFVRPRIVQFSPDFIRDDLRGFLFLGTTGALSALVFWLIWKQGTTR